MSWPHQSPLTQGFSSSIPPLPKSRACDLGSTGVGPQMSSAEAMARPGLSQPVGSDVCSVWETQDSGGIGLSPRVLRYCQAVPATPWPLGWCGLRPYRLQVGTGAQKPITAPPHVGAACVDMLFPGLSCSCFFYSFFNLLLQDAFCWGWQWDWALGRSTCSTPTPSAASPGLTVG